VGFLKKKSKIIFKKKVRERETPMVRLLEDHLHPKVSDFIKIAKNWNEIVGKSLDQKVRPLSLAGNELLIGVEHSALLQHVSFFKDLIAEKIAKLSLSKTYNIRLMVRKND
jgi:hypothetical protein